MMRWISGAPAPDFPIGSACCWTQRALSVFGVALTGLGSRSRRHVSYARDERQLLGTPRVTACTGPSVEDWPPSADEGVAQGGEPSLTAGRMHRPDTATQIPSVAAWCCSSSSAWASALSSRIVHPCSVAGHGPSSAGLIRLETGYGRSRRGADRPADRSDRAADDTAGRGGGPGRSTSRGPTIHDSARSAERPS